MLFVLVLVPMVLEGLLVLVLVVAVVLVLVHDFGGDASAGDVAGADAGAGDSAGGDVGAGAGAGVVLVVSMVLVGDDAGDDADLMM